MSVNTKVWFELKNDDPNKSSFLPQVMNTLVWINMLINNFFIGTILLFFMIGLIMRSFNGQMTNELENSYEQRAEMN